MKAETIAGLNARCDGPNQFEKFDAAYARRSASKEAVLKEEVRLKRLRARKRVKKSA